MDLRSEGTYCLICFMADSLDIARLDGGRKFIPLLWLLLITVTNIAAIDPSLFQKSLWSHIFEC